MTMSQPTEVTYPRVFPPRTYKKGFWYAWALTWFVKSFIVAFSLYAALWIRYLRLLTGAGFIISTIVFGYSCIEILFFLYLQFLSHKLQCPSPESDLGPERCTELFIRVLQSGLATGGGVDPEGVVRKMVESKLRISSTLAEDEGEGLEDGVEEEDEKLEEGKEETPSGTAATKRYSLRTGINRIPKKELPSSSYTTSLPSSRKNSPSPTTTTRNRTQTQTQTQSQGSPGPSSPRGRSSQTPEKLLERRTSLQTQTNPSHSPNQTSGTASPNILIERLSPTDPRAIEFRERLRTWFDHAPFEDLTKQDVLEWLSYVSFNLFYEEAVKRDGHERMLESSLSLLEARCGWKFPESIGVHGEGEGEGGGGGGGGEKQDGLGEKVKLKGLNKKNKKRVTSMKLTLDPVNCQARPFFMYWIPGLINWGLKNVTYRRMGMKVYKEGDMEYLLRIPEGWNSKDTASSSDPIVYIHGLGFGLLQNHFVISQLVKTLPTHPVLVPIQPHISMQIFHHRHLKPYSRTEFVESMVGACKRWNLYDKDDDTSEGIILLSHSNGSVGHGWLLKDVPKIAKRSAFVDPVVFCLWEADVCRNFCYRKPYAAIEILLEYFIASEHGIANQIQRFFEWSSNTLFYEEIPNVKDESKTCFFLGKEDAIIDADRVKIYLERHGVTSGIQMDNDAGHGDGLVGPALYRLIGWLATGRLHDDQP